ncbi:hypothetical protein GWO43_07110 [candidate division KSB1 bacterium]|nr:hypothetical protein [candidate division KSB1 bacterium]NIR72777.1 hypothetical protein [candidate division KSB1 bacterium]NIS23733.1 hypothetical protein [candidate division KSB1 bacterium]NIT70653.1 hypothetical protein [candidate division KSB1 bacterium]NIU24381.1 hypothetical protein [candidate division KSB1 bacterium]
MEEIASKWQKLFASALRDRITKILTAEDGYVLLAIPNDPKSAEQSMSDLDLTLQSRLPNLDEGVSLRLDARADFDIRCECDYHDWAKSYAKRIDDREIVAQAVVDLAVFVNKLTEIARREGFAVWRDEADRKYGQIICQRFRQPINLYGEVARMVFTAKMMEEEITDLLQHATSNCKMLLAYSQKFFQIFSDYRTFVGDHHFVAGRGETELAPGFDYWALLANPAQEDKVFWRGVKAVKQFLGFCESATKHVH